jgi:ABC-2 type transport system permease protein
MATSEVLAPEPADVARPELEDDRPPRTAVVFLALLRRDVFVAWRTFPVLLTQVILQPLFLLFVFGKVLTQLGYLPHGYSKLLFPGIVAMSSMLTALQGTALPLVAEFSFTKEIEDRLLAPIPAVYVALEKILAGAIRAMMAAVFMFPLGVLVLGSIPWHGSGIPVLVALLLLGTCTGSALGLWLATTVPPRHISLVFTITLTPLVFTGCSQYPWPSLSKLMWFKVVTAFNPLTYMSEGYRSALVPAVPHIHSWICLLALAGALLLFTVLGTRGFLKRAMD